MLLSSRPVFFSSAVRRRLIHGSSIFNSVIEEKVDPAEGVNVWGPEKLSQIVSNGSLNVKFFNMKKLDLLKEFTQEKNDLYCTYSFVVDGNVAKDIVKHVLAAERRKKGILVEANPGLGLITGNLINSGASRILVFDESELQDIVLTQLTSEYPEKVTKFRKNMQGTTHVPFLKSLDLGRQHNLPVTIIGVTSNFNFFKGLLYNFAKFESWRSDFEVFMVVSTFVLNSLVASGRHFAYPMHRIFHFLCQIEEIERYPRDAFLPLTVLNKGDMHLIRVTIKPNAFARITEAEFIEYYTFIKILGSSKYNYVIPVLEKWFPNCGPYFISKGISMTNQARDLSQEETVTLFRMLKEFGGSIDYKTRGFSNIFSKEN